MKQPGHDKKSFDEDTPFMIAFSKEKVAIFFNLFFRQSYLRFYFFYRFLQKSRLLLSAQLAEEKAFETFFLFIPVWLGVGSICYFNWPYEPEWTEIATAFLLALGMLCTIRQSVLWRNIVSFILIILVGFLLAKVETMRQSTRMLQNNGFTHFTGRLTEIEKYGDNYRIYIDVFSTESPEIKNAPQHLRLTAREMPKNMKLGEGVAGFALLYKFSGPIRPNSYDFAFQNYFKNIGGQGILLGDARSVSINPPDDFMWLRLKITKLRDFMTKRITTVIDGEAGAIAAALITGERGGISDETNQALRNAGLAHILAISGLHMAMVAGMVMLLCRFIFGCFPVFSSYFASKKIAAFIALFAAAFYLIISGSYISAERSFIMVAVMLIAVICDRTAISLRNLAISAIIILIIWPHEILGPSFQMSFATTAALIATFEIWKRYKRKKHDDEEQKAALEGRGKAIYHPLPKYQVYLHRWIALPLISTIASALVAGVAGGIFSAYHFSNTSPFGVLSNILAFPLMSIIVMPFALLSVILMPFNLDIYPLYVMQLGVEAVESIAYFVADFSPNGNIGYITPLCLIFLTFGLICLIFLRSYLRFISILFFLFGLFIFFDTALPLALISENGRIAAAFNENQYLSLNTNRASEFLLENWQESFAQKNIESPIKTSYAQIRNNNLTIADNKFHCFDATCYTRLHDKKIFITVKDRNFLQFALKYGDVILLNYIMSEQEQKSLMFMAKKSKKVIITQRQLALFGSVEIKKKDDFLSYQGDDLEVQWAIKRPNRPWNEYRRFSKRARGIPA